MSIFLSHIASSSTSEARVRVAPLLRFPLVNNSTDNSSNQQINPRCSIPLNENPYLMAIGTMAMLEPTIMDVRIIFVGPSALKARARIAHAAQISNSKTGRKSYISGSGIPPSWRMKLVTPVASRHKDITTRKKSVFATLAHRDSPINPATMNARALKVLNGSCQLPVTTLSQYVPNSAALRVANKSSMTPLSSITYWHHSAVFDLMQPNNRYCCRYYF